THQWPGLRGEHQSYNHPMRGRWSLLLRSPSRADARSVVSVTVRRSRHNLSRMGAGSRGGTRATAEEPARRARSGLGRCRSSASGTPPAPGLDLGIHIASPGHDRGPAHELATCRDDTVVEVLQRIADIAFASESIKTR